MIRPLLLLLALAACAAADQAPRHAGVRVLRQGPWTVEVMDPDAPDRYHTGTRFSPVAAVLRATWRGRELLDAPVEHDPVLDQGGLAQEFDLVTAPPGFLYAPVGSPFMKVGVGIQVKRREDYRFYEPQEVRSPATTATTWASDSASWVQTAGVDRYAYRYEAALSFDGDALVVRYRLANTGREEFATEQYAHNFIRLDDRPPGPGLEVHYPVPMALGVRWTDERNLPALLAVEGAVARVTAVPGVAAPHLNAAIRPADGGTDPGRITVRQDGLRLTCVVVGQPVGSLRLHVGRRHVCPEQFVPIRLMPGQQAVWERRWEASTGG